MYTCGFTVVIKRICYVMLCYVMLCYAVTRPWSAAWALCLPSGLSAKTSRTDRDSRPAWRPDWCTPLHTHDDTYSHTSRLNHQSSRSPTTRSGSLQIQRDQFPEDFQEISGIYIEKKFQKTFTWQAIQYQNAGEVCNVHKWVCDDELRPTEC